MLYDVEVLLPTKPGTTGASIADIDWDYLETLMTKIYAHASERIEYINKGEKVTHNLTKKRFCDIIE